MGQPLEHIEEIAREESRDYPYPGAATIRQLKAARSFVAATADPETLVNVFVARNEQWADVTMLSAYPAVISTIEAVKAILRDQNPKIPQIPGLLYTLHETMAAAVQAERDKNQSELTAVARTLDTLGPLYPTASARIEEAPELWRQSSRGMRPRRDWIVRLDAVADSVGESRMAYIRRALDERMAREGHHATRQ
ncbi:MAG: hypothetical protein M1596_02820 [Firmicutes bacterium]|nr:hypothetical protein [Bacillota bacterium]